MLHSEDKKDKILGGFLPPCFEVSKYNKTLDSIVCSHSPNTTSLNTSRLTGRIYKFIRCKIHFVISLKKNVAATFQSLSCMVPAVKPHRFIAVQSIMISMEQFPVPKSDDMLQLQQGFRLHIYNPQSPFPCKAKPYSQPR